MRNNRRWFRKSLTMLGLPLIFALAGANGDGDHKETKYRWDIVKITSFNPVTVFEALSLRRWRMMDQGSRLQETAPSIRGNLTMSQAEGAGLPMPRTVQL
jgi:hypothetical protein